MLSHRRYITANGDSLSSALTYSLLIALGPALLLVIALSEAATFFATQLVPGLGFEWVWVVADSTTSAVRAVIEALPVGSRGIADAVLALPGPVTSGALVLAFYAALAVFRAGRRALRGVFGHPVGSGSTLRDLIEDTRDALGLAALIIAFGGALSAIGPSAGLGLRAGVVPVIETALFTAGTLLYLYTVIPLPDRRVPWRARAGAALGGAALLTTVTAGAGFYTDAVAESRGLVYGALTAVVAIAVALNIVIRGLLRILCWALVPYLPPLPVRHHYGVEEPEVPAALLTRDLSPVDDTATPSAAGTKEASRPTTPNTHLWVITATGKWTEETPDEVLGHLEALGRQRDADFDVVLTVPHPDLPHARRLLDATTKNALSRGAKTRLVLAHRTAAEATSPVSAPPGQRDEPILSAAERRVVDAWPQRIHLLGYDSFAGQRRASPQRSWELLDAAEFVTAAREGVQYGRTYGATHLLFTDVGARPRRAWVREARASFVRGCELIVGRTGARLAEYPSVSIRWGLAGALRARGWFLSAIWWTRRLAGYAVRRRDPKQRSLRIVGPPLLAARENWGGDGWVVGQLLDEAAGDSDAVNAARLHRTIAGVAGPPAHYRATAARRLSQEPGHSDDDGTSRSVDERGSRRRVRVLRVESMRLDVHKRRLARLARGH